MTLKLHKVYIHSNYMKYTLAIYIHSNYIKYTP